MRRRLAVPAAAAVLTWVAMVYQAHLPTPVLAEPPEVEFGDVAGYTAEDVAPSEPEKRNLPGDTRFVKRRYIAGDGRWFMVTAVIGGRHKSSIHRPELCLPSQGFLMVSPRSADVDGAPWRFMTLARGEGRPLGFAYTFFNQSGCRTSSSMARIFRDVWDRSVLNRIDRWVMVTVNGWTADDRGMSGFISALGRASPCLNP